MGKIIAVVSSRSGIGKSTIISNLAYQFSENGKTVGVLDANLEFPFLSLQLGIENINYEKTFDEFLERNCSVADVEYALALRSEENSEGKVWAIPRTISLPVQNMEIHELKYLNNCLDAVIKHLALDYLFVEISPMLTEENLKIISLSDQVLILFGLDRQEFLATAILQEVTKELSVDSVLVSNRVVDKYDVRQLTTELKTAYNPFAMAFLPYSEDVAGLGVKGILSEYDRQNPWVLALGELAEIISVS